MKLRQLSLRDIRRIQKEDGFVDVWVSNRTAETEDIAGDVIISVNIDGVLQPVTVYNTWIPICLSEEVSSSDLLNSNNFMKTLNRGRLLLHDPEDCEKFMKNPDAQRELERINNKRNGVMADIENAGMTKNIRMEKNPIVNDMKNIETAMVTGGEEEVSTDQDNRITEYYAKRQSDKRLIGVQMKVYQVATDGDMSEATKMNSYRNNTNINHVDLQYIAGVSTDEATQRWAISALKQMEREKAQVS